MDYFYLDQSPINNKYLIKCDVKDMPFPNGFSSSLNVLAARVMNLSYANYLRFCRDELGASIVGKNTKYPVAYFDRSDKLMMMVKLLNKRMTLIMDDYKKGYEIKKDDKGQLEKFYWTNFLNE